MNLLWPGFLLALAIIPPIIGVYVWVLRCKKRHAVRFSSLTLIREALPRQSQLRRHLPFAFFIIALTSLIVAVARPVSTITVPAGQVSIVVAIDVSRSMLQADISPNRIIAAQDAALSFIQRQQPGTQIGIVAFAGFAELIQSPTEDREALEAAIKSLTTARRTAIGSAILASLGAIAEINPNVPPITGELELRTVPNTGQEDAYVPDIIVLLSDGASNSGPTPLDAAMVALDRRVRVYTIGFGAANGQPSSGGSGQQGEGAFEGNYEQPYSGWFRRELDEETLQAIADLTGGAYYSASSAAELHEVFAQLPSYLVTREENTELSVLFSAIGALFTAIAVILSLVWNPI